jgi:Ca2+/Na+ antiporter
MSSALLIVAGLAGLLVGADLLVRGGAALASRLGVRPIVIGLTVVALGTSLPELAIGIDAVRQGSPGLAVGNIVGTTLVNILFILGFSALIRPIAFERRTLRFDLPAMTGAPWPCGCLHSTAALPGWTGRSCVLVAPHIPLESSGRAARSQRRFARTTRRITSDPPIEADEDSCSAY